MRFTLVIGILLISFNPTFRASEPEDPRAKTAAMQQKAADPNIERLTQMLQNLVAEEHRLQETTAPPEAVDQVRKQMARVKQELQRLQGVGKQTLAGRSLGETTNRIRHLRMAAENLMEAGNLDLAAQLRKQADEMERSVQAAKEQQARSEGLAEQVQALQEEVKQLRAEFEDWKKQMNQQSSPTPATDDGRREPTAVELETAKRAYERLGGGYAALKDYRQGHTIHRFFLDLRVKDLTLLHLPDLPFYYRLDLQAAFSDISLKNLARLPNLRYLSLSQNQHLTDAGLAELAALPQLERLELDFCDGITNAGLKRLAASKILRSLYLGHLKVTDEGLAELAGFPRLEELVLDNCQGITNAGFREIARLKQLRLLSVSMSRQITDDGVRHLAGLQRLEDLCLAFTSVGDSAMKEVARLENLRDLNLFDTRVGDTGIRELSRLKNVQRLYLAGCSKITDVGVKELTTHKGLQAINLFNCDKITDAALKDLGQLKGLREVEIPGCRLVTDAGLKELVGLPQLRNLDLLSVAQKSAHLRR